MKNFLILLLIFTMSGCALDIPCLSPVLSDYPANLEVEVPVKPESHWVDSKFFSDGSDIKITVREAINLCPKDSNSYEDLLIPALGCDNVTNDQLQSTYDNIRLNASQKSANKNDLEKLKSFENPIELCSEASGGSTPSASLDTRRFNTRFKKGDYLTVSLVPNKITITDCDLAALRRKGVLFDADGTYFEDQNCKTSIPSKKVCNTGGEVFIKLQNAYCQKVDLGKPLFGQTFESILGNDFSPYSNLASIWGKAEEVDSLNSTTTFNRKNYIDNGIILDKRITKPPFGKYFQDLEKTDSRGRKCKILYTPQFNTKNEEIIAQEILNNFTKYDLNCYCGRIINGGDGENGIFTYKRDVEGGEAKQDGGNNGGKCSIGCIEDKVYAKIDKKDLPLPMCGGNFKKLNIDQAATRAIGLRVWLIDEGGAEYQRFSKNIKFNHSKEFSGHSMLLDTPQLVTVDNAHIIGMEIDDSDKQYKNNIGGYNVRIRRSCIATQGHKLYMYISDQPPHNILPGDNGTTEVITESGPLKINNPAKGNVYLAIDWRDLDKKQFTDSKANEEKNRYVVSFSSDNVKFSHTVSDFFIKIRNYILNILYGTGLSYNSKVDDIGRAISQANNGKGVIHQIYDGYTLSKAFIKFVRAFCILYIMFSALGYVLGTINISMFDFSIRILKIAFVFSLFSPNSWQFFSDHFFAFFIQGLDNLIRIFGVTTNDVTSFAFLDETLGRLLNSETWVRFGALFFSGPIGWLICILVVWSAVTFIFVSFKGMLLYLQILVLVAFLLSMTPLFLVCLLFNFTKNIFDSWIKSLAHCAIHAVLFFTCFTFFNHILLNSLSQITDYTVCPQCTFSVKIYPDDEGAVCIFSSLLPIGFSNEMDINNRIREESVNLGRSFFGLPFGIVALIVFVIMSNAMYKFLSLTDALASTITESLASIQHVVNTGYQSLLSVVGLDHETQGSLKNRILNSKNPGRDSITIVPKRQNRQGIDDMVRK